MFFCKLCNSCIPFMLNMEFQMRLILYNIKPLLFAVCNAITMHYNGFTSYYRNFCSNFDHFVILAKLHYS